MKDPIFQSLTHQRDGIRSGHLSSYELTRIYIDRIQKLDGTLNVVIRRNFSGALKTAKQMDESLRTTGRTVGPLHGVPFTIKDAFRVKNLSTSFGWPGFRWLPAPDSCKVVDRLVSAGAVLLGQTNVPLSCFDWQTNSPIYGLTRNPLALDRTVGGSSGGSAASVAAYFSPFELGSDVAGSIRYPAHCCGIFGLRPSHAVIPFDDIGPALHKKSFSNIAVAGPLARSIDDLKLVFSVVCERVDDSTERNRLKIGYTPKWSDVAPDSDTQAAIDAFLKGAQQLGHEVVALDPRIDFERCTQVWGILVGYEFKRMLPAPLRVRPLLDLFNYFFNTRRFHEGSFKESFQEGLLANRAKYDRALLEAEELRAVFQLDVRNCDFWATPVAATAAIPHQTTGSTQRLNSKRLSYSSYIGNYLIPTALFHHPVLVAPLEATSDGLPIGIQLHGKPGKDWQLLTDCKKLEKLFSKCGPERLLI